MRKQVNIRIDEELKKDLEHMATEEGRSLNNLIVHLLKCAVLSGTVLKGLKVKKEKEDGKCSN